MCHCQFEIRNITCYLQRHEAHDEPPQTPIVWKNLFAKAPTISRSTTEVQDESTDLVGEPLEDKAPPVTFASGALFGANAKRGASKPVRVVKTPPPQPALGRGMDARLALAYGVADRVRRDFDSHLLPAGQCAACVS